MKPLRLLSPDLASPRRESDAGVATRNRCCSPDAHRYRCELLPEPPPVVTAEYRMDRGVSMGITSARRG